MHHLRIDRLARFIGQQPTRRQALALFAAVAAGGVVGSDPDEAAAKRCALLGDRCGKRKHKHKHVHCCDANARCARRTCVCNTGFGDCDHDGTCETNLFVDPANCGACGLACATGNDCIQGTC
ncbi:MAG TPA: hypothetical protein VFI22_11570, partial [Thermomicrobiales bacterium]|nr:hypothetical protein [Thermomicrobiales bacterium]